MIVDPATLDRAELTALALDLVSPRPIAWVSTVARNGTANLAPFSFFNAFSTAPLTVGVAPGSRNGAHKDTLANIKETGEFTISFVTEELATVANRTSGEFEPEVNEWELAGVTPLPSVVVGPPSVAESPASFECTVFTIVDLGPSDLPTNSLIVARVVRLRIDDAVLADVAPRAEALGLVGRMGGPLWCTTRDRFVLRRPTVAEALAGETPVER